MKINLYQYHNKKVFLYGYDDLKNNPEFIWDLYTSDYGDDDFLNDGSDLQPYEHILAKSPKYAFMYASYILNEPFPEGEDAIAKDAGYAYDYSIDLLFKRFPKGEDMILNSKYSEDYIIAMKRYGDEVG